LQIFNSFHFFRQSFIDLVFELQLVDKLIVFLLFSPDLFLEGVKLGLKPGFLVEHAGVICLALLAWFLYDVDQVFFMIFFEDDVAFSRFIPLFCHDCGRCRKIIA